MGDNKEKDSNEQQEKVINALKEDKKIDIEEKVKIISARKPELERIDIEKEQYEKEDALLESKYFEKKKIINDKIQTLVSNEVPELSKEELEKYGIPESSDGSKEIEDYWYKVIVNSRYFTTNDKDKEILKYLKKVSIEKPSPDKDDFTVIFEFKPNEYFKNEKIIKNFEYTKKDIKAYSTPIEWSSEEMNPTKIKKKVAVKKGKKSHSKTVDVEEDSFFNIFKNGETHSFMKTIIEDESIFFKSDLFEYQLEYYLDLKISTHFGKEDFDEKFEDLEDLENLKHHKGKKKKDECKNQ